MISCPFCEIAGGRRPAHCLYDDERLFVLLDRESLAFGHCMVIPKVHVAKLYELPVQLQRAVFEFASEVAVKLESALDVKAVAFVAIGSGLPHAHLHLVPHNDPDVPQHPSRYIRLKTDDELAEDAHQLAQRVRLSDE
jgi:histidine triad (HIT) family protein